MRSMLRMVLGAVMAMGMVSVAAAEQPYKVMDPPMPTAHPDKIVLHEFFSYACPHCFHFHPKLDALMKKEGDDVVLVRTPMVFHSSWKPLAQAYYAAEVLGVLDKTHSALFDAIHVKGERFENVQQLADFYAKHGVDRKEFLNAYNSFAVDVKMRQGKQTAQDYGVMSTPSVAVNGKYFVTVTSAKGQDGMIQVLEQLIAKERAAGK